MDESHDRTDDADGGRVAAHALKYLGCLEIVLFTGIHFHLQGVSQVLRLAAVDQHLHTLADKGVGFIIGYRFQPQQPLLACDIAPADQLLDGRGHIQSGRYEDPAGQAQCVQKHRNRCLQQNGADRAAGNDNHGRTIDQRVDMTTLKPITANDRQKGDQDADKTEEIESHFTLANWGPSSSKLSTRSDNPARSTAWGMP